ncbi:ornithine carbamoyltransferase [candidate division MSBL1 archaeon SCGC-AAA259D18]|uniref:Ornithine carbamoyltransferase n=2 Tax=candidate division MSBL1 TaxID=215777 RepID=A0A133UAW6_9EURY|nr:ornithine carbamoyltransferase [candidate division MSBL1 archaeon SCGC-AAA259A05]KXA92013.1 ornithine carbamoyltransferase [candidate division MSBL1 archaeon SCGC-AAA259D18]
MVEEVRHFTSIQDLSKDGLLRVLEKSGSFKEMAAEEESHEYLYQRTLGMIFAKPSTRTRVSFEVAMTELGGRAIYLGWDTLQLGRGEPISDTAKTLSSYVDVLMARIFEHEKLLELARNSSVPVINGLTDLLHPCQAVADLFTILEVKDRLAGLKLAYIGDGNNVCHSLLFGASKVGMDVSVASPTSYAPEDGVVEDAKAQARETEADINIGEDPEEAVKGADVVYTDVFVSMGQEEERKRRLKDFEGFRINSGLMEIAKDDAIFMHCLPAHRGEEVTAEVIDGPSSVVFQQAENRLHTEKALLVSLFGY